MKKHTFYQMISVLLVFAVLLEPLALAIPETSFAYSDEEIYEIAEDVSDDIAPQNAEITASGTLSDTVTWTLYADGTLTLDGSGPAGSTDDAEWVHDFQDFQGQINTVIVSEGINKLGSNIFSGQYNLTDVSLPESLTSVGENVFFGCTSLQSIVLPKNMKIIGPFMFSQCSSLKNVVFPENLDVVGWCAFLQCTSLETVTLPPNVYYIGYRAFGSCTALRELTISATNQSVVYLMDKAFDGCQNLVLNIKYERKMVDVTNSPQLFENATDIMVCVPQALYSTYASDPGWSQYDNVTLCPGYNLPIPIVAECDHSTIVAEGNLRGEGTSFVPGETVTITAHMDDGYAFGHWISDDVEFADATSISTTFVMPNTSPTISVSCIGTLSSGQWGDGGTWYVDEAGKLGINGTGPLPTNDAPWAAYKEQISSLIISGDITEIGDQNFKDFIALETVVCPDGISVIGDNAFSGCSSLESIVWPTSLTEIGSRAFFDCAQLVTPELPNGIISIGDSAFSNCSHLNITELPNTVTTIGDNAFSSCTLLNLSALPEGLLSIGDYAFYNCSNITSTSLPQSLTHIGSSAFGGCTGITQLQLLRLPLECGKNIFEQSGVETVLFGQNVDSVPTGMFYGCWRLASISSWGGITKIEDSAFKGCSSLDIPSLSFNLETLGVSSFQNCTSLSIKTIPVKISEIPENCFSECSAITQFTIPSSVTTVGKNAFLNCNNLMTVQCQGSGLISLETGAFSGCTQLSSASLPSSLEKIAEKAFFGCSSLTTVTIPYNGKLYEIGEAAFKNCSELDDLKLPQNLKTIENECFYNCTKLSFPTLGPSPQLPSGLTTLGAYAFYNCKRLNLYKIPNGLKVIKDSTFENCGLGVCDFPDNLEVIGYSAFRNCASFNPSSLPASLKQICPRAFDGCRRLRITDIPFGVVKLGYEAFKDCSSISSITLPETLSSSEIQAADTLFEGCTGLRKVILPSTVQRLSSKMFKGCSNLSIEVHSSGIIGASHSSYYSDTFLDATNITLYVPEEVYPDYLKSDSLWMSSGYKEKITIQAGLIGAKKLTITSQAPNSEQYACSSDGTNHSWFVPGEHITISTSPSATDGNYYYEFAQWTTEDETVIFSGAETPTTTIVMPDHEVEIAAEYRRFAGRGTCGDNITWILKENGTLTIEGFGPMDWPYYPPWHTHHNAIKQVFIDPRITTVGAHAFSDCALLTSVNIIGGATNALPDGVVEIGAYAFSDCPNFSISTLPNGISTIPPYTFQNCSLNGFNLPDTVTSIGDYAFYSSGAVLENGLPGNLVTIGEYAFAQCPSLQLSEFPDTVASIGEGAFFDCPNVCFVQLPSGLTRIENKTFGKCSNLLISSIPSSVTYIGNSAFSHCPKITVTSLPSSITWIGNYAFYNSERMSVETLPNSLRYLGDYAFTSINASGSGFHNRSRNLTSVPGNLEYVGLYAFYNCPYLYAKVLPSSITQIESYAFAGCSNLAITSLPYNLTSLGAGAFSNCPKIRLKTLPSSLEAIGAEAFSGCTGIEELTVPVGVSLLPVDVFKDSGVRQITLLRTEDIVELPKVAHATPFSPNSNTLVCVPLQLMDQYLADYSWKCEIEEGRVTICSSEVVPLQIISEYGTVTASGNVSGTANEFKAGETVTLSAQPYAGYQFLGWTSDDVTLNASAALTAQLVMPASPVTVTANYKEIPKTITAVVTSLTALNVEYGTPADELGLPATVQVTLDDGTSRELSVTWNTSSYDPTIVGVPQPLLGTIVLPDNVLNPNGFTASTAAIVHRKVIYKIASYSEPPTLVTTYGVSPDALALPVQVTAHCVKKGEEASVEERPLAVTWDTANYDPTTFGTYILQGNLGELPDDVENPNDLRPTLAVTVEPIDSWEVGADKDAPEAVIAYLYEDPAQPGELILWVTGTGAMKDFTSVTDVAWATHTATITQVIVEDGVTSVGNNAFRSQANQPNQLHAVCLGSGLKRIGVQAFANCNQLTSITIPASVESIDAQAFRACTKLNTIAFEHSAGAPLTVAREEKKEAFGTVSKLPTMLIGEHEIVKDIAYWTACGRIVSNPVTSIVLTPDSATMNIGAEPLQLVATVLPEGATNNSITWTTSDSAVARVNSTGAVTAVGIGTCIITATNLDTGISATCSITVNEDTSLTWNITQYIDDNGEVKNELILTGVVEIPDFVNGMAAPWWGDSKTISRITVGEGITAIGDHAFYQMTALEEVLLPESVTSIGYRSFAGCTKMKQITLPSFLETIGERAFYGCGGLTEIVIPESVTTIGSQAFFSCSAARTIVFEGENSALESIGSGAFKAAGNKATTVTDHSMNDVVRQYDWAADSRTVTFIP